jgi:hypothetical protein
MFHLRKWYLDAVDGAGRSAILYWSALAWGPVRITWHSATLHEPGRPARHLSSRAASDEPAARGGRIVWRSAALGCEIVAVPRQPAVEAAPLAGLAWTCTAPAARTAVRLGGCEVEGDGYVERLDLSLAPWRLPIDELRWGRWIGDGGGSSIVWIDWSGPASTTLVYLDGVASPAARVHERCVCAGGRVLALRESRVLHERKLGELLAGVLPRLPKVPRRWLALEDRKWLSRGVLPDASGAAREGWAIHERIVFP